jgi:hypothetical protein
MISSLEAANDVPHLLEENPRFPWKQNLSDHTHHPQFMCTSLLTRDSESDRRGLNKRIKLLETRDKTNALVADDVKAFNDLASSVPKVWTRKDLDVEEGEIRIVDFPAIKQFQSKSDVITRLVENVSIRMFL